MMIGEIVMDVLNMIIYSIGMTATVIFGTAFFIVYIDELRHKTKIKWFCQHEYELKFVDGIPREGDRYMFICRKCGKRHEIKTYNKVVERRTVYGSETMLLVHSKEGDYE